MKVKELIKLLEKENPDFEVVVTSSNFEQGHAYKHGGRLFKFKGKSVRKNFRDAFDGETYDSVVVEYTGNENDQTFVQITEE